VLVRGHDPVDYARVLADLLGAPRRLRRMSHAAVRHGRAFGWQATADRLLEVYAQVVGERAMVASA
jgi:D-inositol-3-phosphate glycosyltransferase